MISEKALKGFLFAFLCILAGGFLVLQNGPFQAGVAPISFLIGGGLILLGLIIGFLASAT
jgi:hypothetical protein